MERELRDMGFDTNVIYIDRPRYGAEQSDACEDGTVIDLQRYKILRAMRMILNGQ